MRFQVVVDLSVYTALTLILTPTFVTTANVFIALNFITLCLLADYDRFRLRNLFIMQNIMN